MGAPEESLIPKGRKNGTKLNKKYNSLSREDKLAIQKEIQDINDETEVNAIINKFIQNKILKEEAVKNQEHIDAEADKRDKAGGIKKGMNKGGMPKKNFAKPGSYSSAYNKGGITKKAKTGSMDYRKGGMTYSTSSKK